MMLEFAGGLFIVSFKLVNTTPFYGDFVTNFEHVFVGKIVSSFYFKGV